MLSSPGKELKKNDFAAHLILVESLHVWRMFHDQRYRLQNYTIIDKTTLNLSKLHFNTGQNKLWEKIDWQQKTGRPVRIVLLKARQWGGSTLTGAYLFDCATFPGPYVRNTDIFILSHEMKSSEFIFDMNERFYKYYPECLELPEITATDNNPSSWEFGKLESRITVGTAKNLDVGRGTTRNRLHISEFASYGHAEEAMAALKNTVPKIPNSAVIIESTAKGYGTRFHDEWKSAKSGGNTLFLPVFVAWWEIEMYTMPFDSMAERKDIALSLTPEEKKMRGAYNLQLEQLKWRRFTIKDECSGSEDMFKQEYPSNDREAFLTSGQTRFYMPVIDMWYTDEEAKQKKYPPQRLTVTEDGEYVSNQYGPLQVFEEPESFFGIDYKKVREYLLAIDVAEGISVSRDGKERDDSVIQILKRMNMAIDDPSRPYILEQVAIWRGKVEPIELANIAFHIGMWYNKALIAVERNQSGGTVLGMLNHYHNPPYPYLYFQEIEDYATKKLTKSLGFKTTSASRPMILDTMATMIEQKELIIHDLATLEQCQTFKRRDNGKCEAERGCKDDTVMALAIGCHVNMSYSAYKQPKDSVTNVDEFQNYIEDIKRGHKPKVISQWGTAHKKHKPIFMPPYQPIMRIDN